MNRYDTASVAKFNPMSFQEIMFAPSQMRQKHDASIAAAEAMRLNPDPYSKHYNRALELKQQMDGRISSEVDRINKEGFNPNTTQNIIRLNREHQDLVSATGEVGQINAENVNIKKINQEYDKLGKEKNWGQDTIDYWKNKALKDYNEKPIYDAEGRILKYEGPESIANKIDYNKRLNDLASQAKMSTTEFANAVTQLGIDEQSGYSVANKNSYAHKLGDNYKQVKAAYDTLKKEMSDENSEVYKSMKYEGRDPNSLLDILNTQSDVYKQRVKADEYGNDINPFGSGPKDPKDEGSNTAIAEAVGIGTEVEEALKSLDRYKIEPRGIPSLNVEPGSSGTDQTGGNLKGDKSKEIHFANSLTKSQQKLYAETYNAKVAQGKIKKGVSMYSPEAVKAVEEDWKIRKNFNFTNSVIIPGSSESKILESPSLDRGEAKDRDMFVANRLSLARKNGQQLFFDEEGKSISLDKVKGSVRLVGHYNPSNVLKPFGGNPDNTVSPHVVSYLGTDDKVHTALMPRDLNEVKNNSAFKAAKIINKSVNKSTTNANNFTTFSSKEYPELKNADLSPLGINERGVDGVRVKYNPDEDSFTLEIIKNGKTSKTSALSNKEYQMLMYDIIE